MKEILINPKFVTIIIYFINTESRKEINVQKSLSVQPSCKNLSKPQLPNEYQNMQISNNPEKPPENLLTKIFSQKSIPNTSQNSKNWLLIHKNEIMHYLYTTISRGSKYIYRERISLKHFIMQLKKLDFSESQIKKIISYKKNFLKKFEDNIKEISDANQKQNQNEKNNQKEKKIMYNKDIFKKEMNKVYFLYDGCNYFSWLLD